MLNNGIRWIGSFFINRLLGGIWVPMVIAVNLAVLLAVGLGLLDLGGHTLWLADLAGPLSFGQEAADGLLSTITAVQVAILTLMFSITLLVLTLAAQSLGARLIERWIQRIEIRVSLAQWAGLVAFSLVAQLFVAPGGPDDLTPRLLVKTDLVLTLLALGWMGYAYHRLVRTAHVDTSVAALGRSFARDRQDWGITQGPDPDARPTSELRAWRSGYMGSIDRQKLIDAACACGGRAALSRPDGAFIVEGDVLARLWNDDGGMEKVLRDTCEINDYRADRPSGPFALSLLVEIGARALSPSLNDHETAASCADWIGHGLCARLKCEAGPEGWFTGDDDTPRLHIPEAGVLLQAQPFLTTFNRATRDDPFVAARLIDAYGAALGRAEHVQDRQRLHALIAEVARTHGPDDRSPAETAMIDASLARATGGPKALAAE